ncbi:unnamed protein product [Heligmosomoides polygyrus]|uniref:Methyltransf_21 domain-containing protein n=1 Tax=Heligmosomoides polygyrus TaxID=6339 RepID=A0A183G9P8_HELPZ|nr:unnamed protein product [Heligmosomoides polygyrus]
MSRSEHVFLPQMADSYALILNYWIGFSNDDAIRAAMSRGKGLFIWTVPSSAIGQIQAADIAAVAPKRAVGLDVLRESLCESFVSSEAVQGTFLALEGSDRITDHVFREHLEGTAGLLIEREETRGALKVFPENVIRDAIAALKRQGRALYGFGRHDALTRRLTQHI